MEIAGNNISKHVLRKLEEWYNSPLQFVLECIQAVPSDQQIEALREISNTKRMTIRSGHGCHAKGTIIHMYPYGFKLVEDIEPDDLLMGDDNTPRKVLELYRGQETMYRIKYSDGTFYDVNESHKLALVCSGSKGKYTSGDKVEMSVRDYLKLSPTMQGRLVGYKVSVDYPELPVVIPPYILGLWLGDGSHNKLEITSIDEDLISIWRLFGQANGMAMSTHSGKLHRLIYDKDNVAHKAFEHYNLFGNKHIPKEYLFNSKEVRLKLLAGLLDTDGYADTRNNSVQFQIIQKRKSLAEDILFLAQSCGMHATITKKIKSWTHNYEKKYDAYYEVRISRNTDLVPTQLQRKQCKENTTKQRTNLHFGFTVEKLGLGDYYGFEVDRNHLYVLGDFTVTRNTGKDALASWLALWFLTTRPYPRIACTAPTARQLSDVLWSELSKWLRKSTLADEFVIQKDKIFHKDAPKEWWCRAISPSVKSTKEEQAETLAGLHAEHLLIIVDEASGVSDPTFVPLEGALTQADNKVLLIGNMTKNRGYFYDTHFSTEISKAWTKLHWDSSKSSNVDPGYPPYMASKYGIQSNVYRIRVLGEPPLEDEKTLIPLFWAEQCIGKEFEVAEDEPLYLGVDVARYGDDASIILPRVGLKIMPWEKFQSMNTITLGGYCIQTYEDMRADGLAIDVIGVGAGLADWLEKHKLKGLYQVNVANSSSDITRYDRLRDELWCKVRDNCMLGKYSFPDLKKPGETMSLGQELANELSSVSYDFNAHGGIKVQSKLDLRKEGKASPNIADALCLTEYFANISTRVFTKGAPRRNKEREFTAHNFNRRSKQLQLWQVY